MWIATVDFAKTFDTIRHIALWRAFARFEVEMPYINHESGMFEIQRRTKQGDPLSTLFNTVLQAALEDNLTCWREKCMVIHLGDHQAGDVLKRLQKKRMIRDFKKKHR